MNVVGVQVVILEREEEDAGFGTDDIVREDFVKLPRDVGDALQDRIAPLFWVDKDTVVLVDAPRFRMRLGGC